MGLEKRDVIKLKHLVVFSQIKTMRFSEQFLKHVSQIFY
jgi:hypothetical protein